MLRERYRRRGGRRRGAQVRLADRSQQDGRARAIGSQDTSKGVTVAGKDAQADAEWEDGAPDRQGLDGQDREAAGPDVSGQDVSGQNGAGGVSRAVQRVPPVRRIALRLHRRSLATRISIWIFDIVAIAVVLVGIAVFGLAGREVQVPHWVAERAGARLETGLDGAQIDIGQVTLMFQKLKAPLVSFRDVSLRRADGREIFAMPVLRVGLDRQALLEGTVQPTSLALEGATLRVRREADGRFDLGFGTAQMLGDGGSLVAVLDRMDTLFAQPGFAPIERIAATGLQLTFEDARTGRVWYIEQGQLELLQDAVQVEVRVALTLPNARADTPQEREPGKVEMTFTSRKGSLEATLGARLSGVAASDIAVQSPVLAWLRPLAAPVSGALRASVDEQGALGDINGKLEIGAGAFVPQEAIAPLRFETARAYFRFDASQNKLSFDEISVRAPQANIEATGHAYLEVEEPDPESGLTLSASGENAKGFASWPVALVTQLQLHRVVLNPEGVFATPVAFEQGAANMRLQFDPFRVEIGQVSLLRLDAQGAVVNRASVRGTVGVDMAADTDADSDGAAPISGWHVALDAHVDRIDGRDVIALWPLTKAVKAREWLDKNLIAGSVMNANAALRKRPGERITNAVVFDFEETTVKYLKTFPVVAGARGHAALRDGSFTVSVDEGWVEAPSGGAVSIAGSSYRVLDVKQKPSQAEVMLRTNGSITAGLSLLDVAPLKVMTKAGRGVDLFEGRAEGRARVVFAQRRGLKPNDIQFEASATLHDVVSGGGASGALVPGRVFQAAQLDVAARNTQVTVGGTGTLNGVPFRATWVQPLGTPERTSASHVEGTFELGKPFLDEFDIALPEGMVSGAGQARIRVDLRRGQPATFALDSDLNRIGLRIPALAWRKSQSATGRLQISGTLGAVPRLEDVLLEAPGLAVRGDVRLRAGGGLEVAALSQVSVSDWMNAPVTLTGRGKGVPPAVSVGAGWIDLRKTDLAKATGRGGGGGGGAATQPVELALDRLVLTKGITLRNFRADLTKAGTLTGPFSGSVNGAAPILGQLAPGASGGSRIRITSQDAGALFREAGLFRKGSGGTAEIVLTSRAEPGQYDGTLTVKNTKVQSAPGLAAILNTVSVIGLLDQLNGPGLLFNTIAADFRLTPEAVEVTGASGAGPSLGITMAGIYDMSRNRMDFQGVLSPLYVLNGVGQLFGRRGEGLFGVTYRMTGPVQAPDVSVNPLSVLTPGMFRELFRRTPPTLEKPLAGN
jgi:hypothetical protein